MRSLPCIDRGGLVRVLLVAYAADCLLLSGTDMPTPSLGNVLISALTRMGWLVVFWLPYYLFWHRTERSPAVAVVAWVPLCWLLIYRDILRFHSLVGYTSTANLSATAVTVVLAVLCLSAAFYGMEAVTRTAGVVAVVGSVLIALLVVMLIPSMQVNCLSPWSEVRVADVWREIPGAASGAVMGALYPYVRDHRRRTYPLPVIAVGVVTTVVGVTVALVLGEFASMVPYPFYTAVSAVRIGGIGRVDLLTITTWISFCFVRITLFAVVLCDAVCRVCGDRARIPTLAAVAVTVLCGVWLPPLSWSAWIAIYVVAVALGPLPLVWRKRV